MWRANSHSRPQQHCARIVSDVSGESALFARTRAISSSTLGRMRVDDHVDAGGGRMQPVALVELRDRRRRRRGRTDRAARRISRRARDRSPRSPAHSRRPDWGSPACRQAAPRCGARSSRRRIASSARRVTCGSRPRSMSLAPSSRMTASVPSGTDQSSRREPARGGVARNAGIGDLDREPLAFERLLEPGRKRRLGRQAEAGGQRIAERHDLDRPVGRRAPAPGRQPERAKCGNHARTSGPAPSNSHMSGADAPRRARAPCRSARPTD